MKRFLRYVFYREAYSWLRDLGNNSSNTTNSGGETNERSSQPSADLPIEEGPIEDTDELKRVLQQMDPYEFEHFTADLWERMTGRPKSPLRRWTRELTLLLANKRPTNRRH